MLPGSLRVFLNKKLYCIMLTTNVEPISTPLTKKVIFQFCAFCVSVILGLREKNFSQKDGPCSEVSFAQLFRFVSFLFGLNVNRRIAPWFWLNWANFAIFTILKFRKLTNQGVIWYDDERKSVTKALESLSKHVTLQHHGHEKYVFFKLVPDVRHSIWR